MEEDGACTDAGTGSFAVRRKHEISRRILGGRSPLGGERGAPKAGMEWYKDDGVSLQECAFTTQFLITWFSEGHSPIFLFKFQKSKKVPSVFSDGTGSDLSD